MAAAVREFLETYPAIRLQHRPDYPVGKGLEAWQDAEGATHLKALIVDDQAKRMVRKGVLRAWSVGLTDVQTQKSARAPRFEIVGFRLTEVSLVDSPSNARCGIQVVAKSAAGSPRYIGTVYRVTKLGRVKVTKARKRVPAGPDDFLVALLGSSDPAQREMARSVLSGRHA